MLLTRRACYGLIAAKHLAEHAGEGSFSAHDLAECYGLPHEALAKVLQRLSAAGVLMSPPREQGRHLESVPGYHQLPMVHQVVADTLRELTIEDCYNLRS